MLEISFAIAFGFILGFFVKNASFTFLFKKTKQLLGPFKNQIDEVVDTESKLSELNLNKDANTSSVDDSNTPRLSDTSSGLDENLVSNSKMNQESKTNPYGNKGEKTNKRQSIHLNSFDSNQPDEKIVKIDGHIENAIRNLAFFNDQNDITSTQVGNKETEDDSSDTESQIDHSNESSEDTVGIVTDVINIDPSINITTSNISTCNQSLLSALNFNQIFNDNHDDGTLNPVGIPEENNLENTSLGPVGTNDTDEIVESSDNLNEPLLLLEEARLCAQTENIVGPDNPKNNLDLYLQDDGLLNNQNISTTELNRSVDVTDTRLFESDQQDKQDEQIPTIIQDDDSILIEEEESFRQLILEYHLLGVSADQVHEFLFSLHDDHYVSTSRFTDHDSPQIQDHIRVSTEVTT